LESASAGCGGSFVRASPLRATAGAAGRFDLGEFREVFRSSPIQRAKYAGFLRYVVIAMGNNGQVKFREPLEKLAAFEN
jgi:epoxyqueuosine reductase QueG